jgi:GTP cyclohydrolase IIa
MVKVGILKLLNYESWINLLGYDREHTVQAKQHELLKELYRCGAEIGAFTIPLTLDLIVLILNSVETRKFLMVARSITKLSPTPIKAMVGYGKTYPEALTKAGNPEMLTCSELNEQTIVAHADLNGYYTLLEEQGIYHTYKTVTDLIGKFRKITHKIGGITTYLGGDNILAFLPNTESVKTLMDQFSAKNVKVGIGIALTPRKAVALAAKALASLRKKRSKGDTKTIFEVDGENQTNKISMLKQSTIET